MNTATSTTTTGPAYNNDGVYPSNYGGNQVAPLSGGKKKRAYKNRPGKRQIILELLSIGLLLASAPAFLGGVFGIFICIATFILSLIGLFAWTRRHAALFALLALLVIGGCVVNIILRATFTAQCMPFYNTAPITTGAGINSNHYDNNYTHSIWCGNRFFVYIDNAIIIILAIPALLVALSLLRRKKAIPVTERITETKTTRSIANTY